MNFCGLRKILLPAMCGAFALFASDVRAGAIPVALTLSGGVSLGAYQAGSLYYTSLVVRENPELFKTMLLTGASAGALNAVHAVLSICGEESLRPAESSFYRSWVDFRAKDFTVADLPHDGLLSRAAFDGIARELETKWRRGLPASCDVVLGLSVTRLHALEELSKIGFARQGEKIILRIRGQGFGRPPRITNYVNSSHFPKPLRLDLKPGDDAQNFQALKDVLFASAAFPVAFAPQALRTCIARDEKPMCSSSEVEEAKFVDGGILDNKPLALAEKIIRTGLAKEPENSWLETPSIENGDSELRSRVLYFYSDLAAKAYTQTPAKDDAVAFTIAPMLLGNVFNPVRNQDSSSLLENAPAFENQIVAPKSGIPRMGDPLFGFFGFFEREFRSFDFYLGLWETREFITDSLRATLHRGGQNVGAQIHLPKILAGSNDERKLNCLDAVFKERPEATSVCAAVRDLESPNSPSQFPILARLAYARWKEKRPDFTFMARRLATDRYEFRDLGLQKDEAWRAPARIKTESIRAMSRLASEQSLPENIVFRAVGPAVLNVVEPLPIENDFAVSVGPQSLFTFSSLIAANEALRYRWTLGLGLEGFIATPFTGFEFEPTSFQTGLLQTRLSVGLGYKETDVTTRAGLSLTLAERFRLQTDLEIMPFRKEGAVPWRILPSVGIQFYF